MTSTTRATALLLLASLGGCAPPAGGPAATAPPRPLADAADSLAARIEEAAGGAAAFEGLQALRFDFASVRDSVETSRRRHLWEVATGRYRLEWSEGDSQFVALFSTHDVVDGRPAGRVYLEGAPLDTSAAGERLEGAYRRFINDTYWLLAPLKLFDTGVTRRVERDSADADTEVLAIAFEGVGLTPGDRYWLRASRATGRLQSWRYVLESGHAGGHAWQDPQEVAGPAGPLRLDARKVSLTGGGATLTPAQAGVVNDSSFIDPAPRLTPLGGPGAWRP